MAVSAFFRVDTCELFPEHMADLELPSNIAYTYVSGDHLIGCGRSPLQIAELESDRKAIVRSMGTLSEREAYVVSERFFSNKTLEQLGDELELTKERVRRIEMCAIKKMGNSIMEER